MSERSERTVVTVQYRVVVSKQDERVEGPDDAALVVTIPAAEARDEAFDATVAFMRGRLKSTGSTGALFDVLRSGAASDAIRRLASQP